MWNKFEYDILMSIADGLLKNLVRRKPPSNRSQEGIVRETHPPLPSLYFYLSFPSLSFYFSLPPQLRHTHVHRGWPTCAGNPLAIVLKRAFTIPSFFFSFFSFPFFFSFYSLHVLGSLDDWDFHWCPRPAACSERVGVPNFTEAFVILYIFICIIFYIFICIIFLHYYYFYINYLYVYFSYSFRREHYNMAMFRISVINLSMQQFASKSMKVQKFQSILCTL